MVAKGFEQIEGIDFSKTDTPVVKVTSIRMILSIVAVLNFQLHQMDVKKAFLNQDLNKTVYMKIPERFCRNEKVSLFVA